MLSCFLPKGLENSGNNSVANNRKQETNQGKNRYNKYCSKQHAAMQSWKSFLCESFECKIHYQVEYFEHFEFFIFKSFTFSLLYHTHPCSFPLATWTYVTMCQITVLEAMVKVYFKEVSCCPRYYRLPLSHFFKLLLPCALQLAL